MKNHLLTRAAWSVLSTVTVVAAFVACEPAKEEKGAAGAAGADASAGGSSNAGSAGTSAAGAAGDAGAGGTAAGAGGTAAGAGGAAAGAGGTAAGAGGTAAGAGGTAAGAGGTAAGAGGTAAGAGGTAAGAGGTAAGAGGTTAAGAGGGSSTQVWKSYASPCGGGSKISAMWFDDAKKGFAGCGELADGKGLHTTGDGGKTWVKHPKFDEVRVVDLRRGDDGVLYGAGTDTVLGFSAWKVDEAAPANLKIVGLYTPSNQAFTSVGIGENIARTADGKLMVDSLTGGSVALAAPGGAFVEYSTLHEDAIADPKSVSGFAPRKIKTFGNDFFAVGNKINEPATLFLPTKQTSASGFYFQRLELQNPSLDAEPYDLHVWSATRMVVVGWDQSYRYPLIFVCDGDPSVLASWKQIDLLDFSITYKGGVNGLSAAGDALVLVGTKFPADGGFVLRSPDGGKTWTDLTPTPTTGKPDDLYRAKLFADGRIVAAGGSEVWIYE